jgi:tetratricopeptide (TPR) repeat protein
MEMWADAIRFLDKAIKITPSLDALYLYKSTYLLHLGEQKKAKMVLKEGIKKTKDPEKDLGNELNRLNDLYPNI